MRMMYILKMKFQVGDDNQAYGVILEDDIRYP